MKRSIGLIVGFVAVVAAGFIATSKAQDKTKDAEKEASVQKLRADYLEKVGSMRTNPDEKSYKEELAPFFRAYFNAVDAHIKRHGGNPNFDGYLEELEKREAKGKGEGGRGPDRKAVYETTKGIFDKMREGKYLPIYSATDKGMRLDILSTDVKMVGGSPKVRYQMVVWGASRDLKEDGKNKRMVTSATFSVNWKLFDEKGKLLGKMDAAGDPSMKIDWPERFIPEFPPQMLMGHYDLDLMPAEVKGLEISFQISSRSSTGSEAVAVFPWKLEAPSDWKLKPGEKWAGAEETTASPEEINPSAKK